MNAYFLYGTIAEAVPEDLTPPEMWPEFGALALPAPICAREYVGTHPRGTRWSLWPLCFEEYVSDVEPDLVASKKGVLARNRLVRWKRRTHGNIPKGWHVFSKHPWRVDGFFDLRKTDAYTEVWNKNARRELRLWKEFSGQGYYTIEKINPSEFRYAYKKSSIAKHIGIGLLDILEKAMTYKETQGHVTFWGVRDKKTGNILAGMAVHHSPSHKSSVQECPFLIPGAERIFAMTGLIDHWFQESKKRNDSYLLFTYFWHVGEPKSWKGFSEFKSHFGLEYIAYPPMLVRFVPGKIF